MGYAVHMHVCFSCEENEPVAALAKKHLEHLPAITGDDEMLYNGILEARWFLKSLSERTGDNAGLSMWGIKGSYYTDVDKFIEVLHPFLLEMFETETGVFDFEHIIVFEERQQWERTIAHEISYNKDSKQVVIQRHICPFAFMQM
jgi:hypothetical protein